MKKSVLLIGNYPPPYGGVPRVIEDLAPYLVEQGWDVHVFSGGDGSVDRKDGFTVYHLRRSKLRMVRLLLSFLPKMLSGERSGFFRLIASMDRSHAMRSLIRAAYAARIIEDNDIGLVVAYNLYSGAPVGAMVSLAYGLPLVVSNFGEIISSNDYFVAHKSYVKLICNMATQLTSMTRHCASTYKLLGMSPDVEVIPVGVDTQRFRPDRDGSVIRNRLGIKPSDKVVIFVGRQIEDMGLHTVLAAAPDILERANDVSILVVGTEGELTPSAREMSDRCKGRFFVVTEVPLEELPLYYAAATILVAPTKGDRACGSLSAAEAMATGKPVIAARVGGVPEFVIHGDTGFLIPPDQPAVLADHVLSLLADEESLRAMGQRARKRAENVLDTRKTNEMHERLFSRTLGV